MALESACLPLPIPNNGQERSAPDGHLSTVELVIERLKEALEHVDPGCR